MFENLESRHSRRDLMRIAGAMVSAASMPDVAGAAAPGGGYFLSKSNPVANRDQLAVEEMALRLWARADVQEARRRAGMLWRTAYGVDVPEEAKPTFEQAIDEYVFNYLLKGGISDANHPRIVRDFMPPYSWFDREVRGARMGGDNPDNCYRLVGIAHGGHYRLHGKPWGPEPSNTTFTLMANYGTSKTVQTLEATDLVRGPDGAFVIEIDDRPAGGRPNHMRTTPDTVVLFVRDSMGDWGAQTPFALQVERLNPTGAPPISDEEAAATAIRALIDEVPLYYWFTRLCSGKPVNEIANPLPSSSLGGLVTQRGTQARLQLSDEDAMIVRIDPAGARYTNFVLQDWWFRTIDYDRFLSSITSDMARRDADGSYTLVVSSRDPGVHNWVETGGLHNLLVVARWQGLPKAPGAATPTISARRVALKNVMAELGASAHPISDAERQAQRAARTKAYQRRISA